MAVTYSNSKKWAGWHKYVLWVLQKLYPTTKKTNTIAFNISSSKVRVLFVVFTIRLMRLVTCTHLTLVNGGLV